MKKLKALLVVLFTAQLSFAQLGLNLTYQYGIAGKDLYSSEMNNSLVGLNAKLLFGIDDYLSLSLGTGYYIIPFEKLAVDGVQQAVDGVNLSVIPVTVGAQFNFIDQRPDNQQKLVPYLGLDVGIAFTNQSKSDIAPAQSQTNVLIAPSFGVNYKMTDNLDLNCNFRENFLIYSYRQQVKYYEVFSLLGFNLGVNYKF